MFATCGSGLVQGFYPLGLINPFLDFHYIYIYDRLLLVLFSDVYNLTLQKYHRLQSFYGRVQGCRSESCRQYHKNQTDGSEWSCQFLGF